MLSSSGFEVQARRRCWGALWHLLTCPLSRAGVGPFRPEFFAGYRPTMTVSVSAVAGWKCIVFVQLDELDLMLAACELWPIVSAFPRLEWALLARVRHALNDRAYSGAPTALLRGHVLSWHLVHNQNKNKNVSVDKTWMNGIQTNIARDLTREWRPSRHSLMDIWVYPKSIL